MRSHVELNIKLSIRKYGETVQHKKRVKTDLGNGEYEYTYEVQEPKRGQFTQIMPDDETINRYGARYEADHLGTFLPGTRVHEGDLLYVADAWCEVTTKFPHRTGGVEDYFEVLLRRRKA